VAVPSLLKPRYRADDWTPLSWLAVVRALAGAEVPRMKAAEFRAQRAKAISEDELAEQTATLGILRYHTHDSRRSEPGFPDEVLVGRRRMLYRELKQQGKKPTAAQQKWLDRLQALGHDVGVWRPEDLLSGRILREMREAA
jgi:hypothetical protein